ncbi:hypothetical protein [Microbacterium sp. P05]|uniref:hypothetical protein n=1 Tax=Microbacterium sp. P05 TaxID=3366948 RepID=UPI00374725DD
MAQANRLAGVAGRALRALFAALLLVRRPRPIHARGRMLRGELVWLGTPVRSGIQWIDEPAPGPVELTARLSRSIGLPAPLPDVIGLALRLEADGRPADIELASTGFGPATRFALLAHRSPSSARLGTLLPYRSDLGPLLLCARTVSEPLPSGGSALDEALRRAPWRLRLSFAHGRGLWHPFADLSLALVDPQPIDDLRFDAVRRALPGAGTYAWVRALRQPSYHLAQD